METVEAADPTELSYAIIGAGFSGLGMAMKLKASGRRDFLVLEKASDLGGCWRDNTYPGCACDIPSHLYSLSFEQKSDWSRKYPPQEEILEYLRGCAEKHGLMPCIEFNAEVVCLRYLDEQQRWQIELRNGRYLRADFVIMGKGPLHVPHIPRLPGLDSFKGPVFHSSQWDHRVDLEGKKVASIGTGASAIQYIPRIASRVDRLTVFQRSPAWIVPRPDRRMSGLEKKLFAWFPPLQRLYRQLLFSAQEMRFKALKEGTFMHRLARRQALKHLGRLVRDPQKRRKLTPDYTMGCKRILVSDDFYPAMDRDNVRLIASGVQEVTEHHVIAEDGSRCEADVIVLGTGFEVSGTMVPPGMIIGPRGEDLGRRWRQHGVESYRGVSVAGMPNLFLLVGPNTGLGHNSMILMIEAQIRYILKCLDYMEQEGLRQLDVKPSAAAEFTRHVQSRLGESVWGSGCRSWYLDRDGVNVSLWPDYVRAYQRLMKKPVFENYHWL